MYLVDTLNCTVDSGIFLQLYYYHVLLVLMKYTLEDIYSVGLVDKLYSNISMQLEAYFMTVLGDIILKTTNFNHIRFGRVF